MLCGIYAPSDLVSSNAAPDIPLAEKLRLIADAQITITHDSNYEFDLWLPFIKSAAFTHSLPSTAGSLVLERIDLGDAALCGHGISSRLLGAAARFAVGLDSDITSLTVDEHPRLGLLNTAVRVFGKDNVVAGVGGALYGGEGNRELEEIFDDHPVREGEPYLLSTISASIDPKLAMTWEVPVS